MVQFYKIYFLDYNLVRRVALFYILKNLLNVLVEALCILIPAFYFTMLCYHKSYSLCEIPVRHLGESESRKGKEGVSMKIALILRTLYRALGSPMVLRAHF